jgi:hypothetical protein
MKKQTKLTARFICALLFALFLFKPAMAQPPYWKLNGNPFVGPDAVTVANNFFGTDGANNTALRLGTFGITRMFIQNNTGPTAGFVGTPS